MSDTPRVWCPACEPLADQIAEMLETQFCGTHFPDRTGPDDVLASFAFDAGTEAEQSRALCAFVHRAAR